jgi:hypothetical protein
VQFNLLHIPAIVQHGNTLTLEEFGRWHTPAHILGGWEWKIRPLRHNALLTPATAAHVDDTHVVETPEPLPPVTEAPAPIVAQPVTAEPMQPRQKPQQLTFDLF